mgnify:CR=1 FL=1
MRCLWPALLLGPLACRPAGPSPAARGAPPNGGVAEVRAALGASVAAWNRGDLDGHVAVYADTGTAGPPFGPGGRARARAGLAAFFAGPRPNLALDSLVLRPLGADYVLAAGRYRLAGAGAARAGWFTEVWARTAAGWRIVHDHSP